MTIQEQITALENALATGARSVTIGDRNITYRDTEELLKIIARFKSQLSSSSGSSFSITQINYNKGL